jgi:hypothetical protein
VSARGLGESGSVQVVVNALLVCVCVECQSSHKQCSGSCGGVWLLSGSLSFW